MSDRSIKTFLAIAALCVGVSLLIAVINLGAQIATTWLLIFFQIAIALLTLMMVLGIIEKLYSWMVYEIANLQRKHAELLKLLRQRTPWFIAVTLLVSQAVLAIADKLFDGKELPTVAVTLVLIILFFTANEFMTRESKIFQVVGFVLWFFSVVALPLFVWADRGFDTAAVLDQMMKFPLAYKVFYGLCIPAFFFLPILFASRKSA